MDTLLAIRHSLCGRYLTRVIAGLSVILLTLGPVHARSFSALSAFEGKNGANPWGRLVRDQAGNLYGTTLQGGDNHACDGMGCGVVFTINKAGHETVLHTFTGGADGASPQGVIVRDSLGNLYGTASLGGSGNGVVFMIDPKGAETVLYTFSGGADGSYPSGDLLLDGQGNLYGVTPNGGNIEACNPLGCGVVFKLTPAGTETVLYAFTGGSDGRSPQGLTRDGKGNLYGTAAIGGDTKMCNGQGCGVVFKLSTAGELTVLHTFEDRADSAIPNEGLVRDSAGNLYGTTQGGMDLGTVFKVHGRTKTILHSFKGTPDGRKPVGGLVRDKAGNLYGATFNGGTINNKCTSSGCGTVFRVDANGVETILHPFNVKGAPENGAFPRAGLTLDSKGNLYGTTFYGGDIDCGNPKQGCGVVFELTP